MAAISLFSVARDLEEFNYSEAMWGYSLCAAESIPGRFNIHVADANDEIVASGEVIGNISSAVIMVLAAFYKAAIKAQYGSAYGEPNGAMPFHEWLLLNIEPKVAQGFPKHYLMTPDKVWSMYLRDVDPRKPQGRNSRGGKTWAEKVASGEIVPCGDSFEIVDKPVLGRLYHLAWAGGGCVWRLKAIDGESCTLITPSTMRERTAKVKDLRHTRANQSGS